MATQAYSGSIPGGHSLPASELFCYPTAGFAVALSKER